MMANQPKRTFYKRPTAQSSWQSAYNQAKQTNEARYAEILAGYQKRYQDVMGELQGSGAQEYADIGSRMRSSQAAGAQDLVSRGLAGTTVMPTMRAGYARQAEGDYGRLADRLRTQRTSAMAGLSGDTLGFMERREDEYPDQGLMTQLMQQYGYGSNQSSGRVPIMERMARARMYARMSMGK